MDRVHIIILISFLMGVLLMALLRYLVPWKEMYEKIYWVAAVGLLVLFSLSPIDSRLLNLFISPLLAGTIVYTVLSRKFIQWKNNFTAKLKEKERLAKESQRKLKKRQSSSKKKTE